MRLRLINLQQVRDYTACCLSFESHPHIAARRHEVIFPMAAAASAGFILKYWEFYEEQMGPWKQQGLIDVYKRQEYNG